MDKTQRLVLATLGGAGALFLMGYLIWGLILGNIQTEHTTYYDGLGKENPNMWLIFFSMVCTSFVYTWIFDFWGQIATFKTGAKAGALIASIIGLGYDLMYLATMNLYDWTIVGTDLIGNLAWGAIGGGVIGWILGYQKK